MIPNDRAAIILNLLFGEPALTVQPESSYPPAPRAELLEALATIHQFPVAVIEEALLK